LTNVHFKKGLDFGVATWDTLITTTPSEGHTPTFARGVDFTSGICTDSCFRSNGFRVDGAGNTVIGEGAWNGAAGYGWLTLNGTSGSSLSFDLAAVEVVRQQVSTTYFSINNFSATSPTLFVNNGNTGLRLDPNGSVTMANLPVSAGGGGLAVCVDTAGKLYKKAACP
jgi:hypothetical protein